jgi:hypothetical protein
MLRALQVLTAMIIAVPMTLGRAPALKLAVKFSIAERTVSGHPVEILSR